VVSPLEVFILPEEIREEYGIDVILTELGF
jgi:hypothetical protein